MLFWNQEREKSIIALYIFTLRPDLNSFHQLSISLNMTSTRVTLLFPLVLIAQAAAQDMRSLQMSFMHGGQFQCMNTSCLPFVNISVADIRQCQLTCLALVQCQAASFQRTASTCELFAFIPNQTVYLSARVDTTAMIVDFGTRMPMG